MGAPIDRVIVWERPDGISVTYFYQDMIDKSGMDTDAYIAKHIGKLINGNSSTFGTYSHSEMALADIPKGDHAEKHREGWKKNGNRIDIDTSKVEAKEAKKNGTKGKFKALGFTNEEIEQLVK